MKAYILGFRQKHFDSYFSLSCRTECKVNILKTQNSDTETSQHLEEKQLYGTEVMGMSFVLYKSIRDIAAIVDFLETENYFLEVPFLEALESSLPPDIHVLYGLLYRDDIPLGFFYFQYKYIDIHRSLHPESKPSSVLAKMQQKVEKKFTSLLNSNVLVLGNLLLTGTHGMYLHPHLDRERNFIIRQVIEVTATYLEGIVFPVKAFLVKDYFENNRLVEMTDFIEFTVQPNMIFTRNPAWNTYQDYLYAMKSKYRVRERRARKLAREISSRHLEMLDLQLYRTQMHQLYRNIMTGADFNLFELPLDYFINMKAKLDADFHIMGYFMGSTLVGFATYITHQDTVDAHFLGYDPLVNKKHSLYLNMLYDLIFQSFRKGAAQVVFSRTAMSIKSSVGAEPKEMYLYARTESKLLDSILPKALNILKPDDAWTPRRPFKEPTGRRMRN